MASFIIRDARIFTGESTIDEGFVLVDDGKIKAVGSMANVPQLDSSVKVYSKPNHTLLPGLIDCHIHADRADPEALPQALRFGVTTVLDMHNELPNVLKLKKQTQEPDTAAYKTAGQAATIENGWPIPVIVAHDKSPETLAEIAKWPKLTDRNSVVEYLDWTTREMQPDYIKLMHESGAMMGTKLAQPTVDLQRTIVEEARSRGYLTVAHATSLQDTLDVLRAGVNGLTHTFCDQAPTDELIAAYKKNNAWCNPTLAAMGSLTSEGAALQHRFAHDPRVAGLLSDAKRGNMCACMSFAAQHGKVAHAYASVRALRAAGIDILCGSDAAGPAKGTAFGLSMHHELSLFVNEVGMSPAEALRSATSLVAERFGFKDRGRLEEGRNADLLLVEGDLLGDIGCSLDIRGVWREGRLCGVYQGVAEK
ncbi:amidohydrolase [Stagonosporopsis vannaccii]|nr:amidohydrolase [Stagonosporopsis vannaccii]